MDDIGKWNSYIQSQIPLMGSSETELLMTLTVPLSADQDVFRVGWDLKRPGGRGWVAITTGSAVWPRQKPQYGAQHVLNLIEECNRILEGHLRELG